MNLHNLVVQALALLNLNIKLIWNACFLCATFLFDLQRRQLLPLHFDMEKLLFCFVYFHMVVPSGYSNIYWFCFAPSDAEVRSGALCARNGKVCNVWRAPFGESFAHVASILKYAMVCTVWRTLVPQTALCVTFGARRRWVLLSLLRCRLASGQPRPTKNS